MPVRPSWLLASDMDGTVIPLDRDPKRGEEIRVFSEVVGSVPALALAYVTGRSLPLALKGMEEFQLPPAAFLAVDVGTRVYVRTPDGYAVDPEYDARMSRAVGGPELIEVCRVLDEAPGLFLQPDWGQGRFKRSYFLDSSLPDEEVVAQVRDRLAREGACVNAVTSRDPLRDIGLLDILPEGVAKDEAVRHLQGLTRTPTERTLYAGDSGNDWAAFLAGYSGIVVENAPESLKARLRQLQANEGNPRRLFFAKTPFAGGVVEGLRHYGVV